MSPEQARGREVDHRTDIYSFGAMLYELLTGELLFSGGDYFEVISAHANTEPEPPSERNPELPEELDEPLLWMLQKSADKRPPNLVTALQALERAARDAGLEVPDAPPPSGVFSRSTTPVPDGLALAITKAVDSSSPTEPDLRGAQIDISAQHPTEVRPAPATIWPWIAVAVGVVVVAGSVYWLGTNGGAGQPTADDDRAYQAAPRTSPQQDPGRAEQQPRLVNITIKGAPDGTSVYGPAGKPFGQAPGVIQVERGNQTLQLHLRADGFESKAYAVVPSADLVLEVALIEQPADQPETRGQRPPKKDPAKAGNTRGKLEDPFSKKGR
jgi:serine/threonine-protein kinase